jgi:hypothetical protein
LQPHYFSSQNVVFSIATYVPVSQYWPYKIISSSDKNMCIGA